MPSLDFNTPKKEAPEVEVSKPEVTPAAPQAPKP